MRAHVGVVVAALLGNACMIHATAPQPTPNLPEPRRAPGSARLIGVEAPEHKVCSETGGLKDFCVTGFRTALSLGLEDVVSRFFQPPSNGRGDFQAQFRMLEFSHSPTSGGSEHGPSVQIAMRWQFNVKRADGSSILELTETTVGPQQLINVGAADTAVAALNNAVLERIARALHDARPTFDPAASPPLPQAPAAAPARSNCVPGSTQECVGPGGCKGGQFCAPDGLSYSPCDCGSPPNAGAK